MRLLGYLAAAVGSARIQRTQPVRFRLSWLPVCRPRLKTNSASPFRGLNHVQTGAFNRQSRAGGLKHKSVPQAPEGTASKDQIGAQPLRGRA